MTDDTSGPRTGSGRLPATSLVACKVAPVSGGAPALASQVARCTSRRMGLPQVQDDVDVDWPRPRHVRGRLGLLGVDRELLLFTVGVLLVVAGAWLSRRSTF